MTAITPARFERLLRLACAWAEENEARILEKGIRLTPRQIEDALSVHVVFPEKVRLLPVGRIPTPKHPFLKEAIKRTGLISSATAGQTLRYGIFIRKDCWRDRALVAHELAHVHQYERLGGFEAFLRQYLSECLTVGYVNSPLELEAATEAARACQGAL